MKRSTPGVYPVRLDDEQRARLREITRHGDAGARKIRHAHVLLLSDRGREGGHLTRDRVAQQLDMHVNSVDRLRKRFVQEGEEPALNRRPRLEPPVKPVIDGEAEAHLVAICCSPPPEGRVRWTLALLAKEMMGRKIVTHVCAETVGKALKKMSSSRGGSGAGASPSVMRHAS